MATIATPRCLKIYETVLSDVKAKRYPNVSAAIAAHGFSSSMFYAGRKSIWTSDAKRAKIDAETLGMRTAPKARVTSSRGLKRQKRRSKMVTVVVEPTEMTPMGMSA